MSAEALQLEQPLDQLPLVTLFLTERCNSRCASCDYWRNGHVDMTLRAVDQLLPDLLRLHTRVVLISGGEPLINPDWAGIAALLRASGLRSWLLTSGLALAKHAARVAPLFDAVTVSLDGATPEVYRLTRGVDAFAKVCEGIQSLAALGVPVGIRVTVQRANYHQLEALVVLASDLGARQVSFVAVDIASSAAFGREGGGLADLALRPEDLPRFARVLQRLEHERADAFASGLIAESPRKLRRMQQYFAALCGLGEYPAARCNVYDYSAVIGARGQVSPCFFIPGPAGAAGFSQLGTALNGAHMRELRGAIRAGRRVECARCVCSLWRTPEERSSGDFLMRR